MIGIRVPGRRALCGLFAAVFAMQWHAPLLAASDDGLPADLAGDGVPQVLTPARLRQAQADVAASVTVIDREMIAALGARDIPELLRLVPGMMVTRVTGSEYSVSYHGTNIRDIRRLQVLIDGMSVYQPALARVLWSDLAVSIDDIDRIEVTRGPNAAAYGANAFSGVINIITIHPQDSTDNMVRVAGGTRETIDSAGRVVGHGERGDWRLSFGTRADSGYDKDRYGFEYRDDRSGGVMNLRSEYRPTDTDRLEFQAGIKDGSNEEVAETHDVFTRYEIEPTNRVQNLNLLGRWTHELSADHSLQMQGYVQHTDIRNRFRACLDPILLSDELAAFYAADADAALGLLDLAASNPPGIPAYIGALAPALQPLAMATVGTYGAFQFGGYTEACGNANLDITEGRVDLEVQDTLRVNDRLRIVSGGAFRRDSGNSESYTHRLYHNDVWRLFGHGEYRLADPLILNLGAMLESDDISGSSFSPRAGLNWRFRDQQSLRAVISRAVRSQDIYEEYANIGLTFRDLAPAWPIGGGTTRNLFLTQQSPGSLQPEEILSRELGYFGYFPAQRLDVDVRWFTENLNKLISDPANLFSFAADNDSFTDLTGIEGQVRHSFAPGSWVWASYAYIDNDSSHRIEQKFTALHSGSVAIAHRFASRWSGSAAWYVNRYQNRRGPLWSQSERIDLRVARDIPLGGATLQVSANAQCRLDDVPEIFIDNNYDDRVYGFLGLQLTY